MMLFLAQTTPNLTIQQWLTQLVPMAQIVQIVGQVLPAFVAVGVFIVCIGYLMMLAGSEDVFIPSHRLLALFVAMAASPWLLTLAQQIANALVGAIAGADPALNWLPVNNPGSASLAMDFTKPFSVIGQYVGGTFAQTSGMQWWQVDKWTDYVIRGLVIAMTGFVACVTVFIMEVMLILQKLIVVASGPLMPISIACLSIRAAEGSAQNFLKSIVGVMCWPVGWALVHIGTMAALQNLQAPSWTASLFQLVLSGASLGVVCLWMVVGTIGAPFLIARAVTSGSNFAAELVGGVAGAAGQHAAHGVKSGTAVAGALVGSTMGPGGALAGVNLGTQMGNAGAALVASATESAEGVSGERRAIPSSRSAGIADAAIQGIVKGV
jgi:hypothetical protein